MDRSERLGAGVPLLDISNSPARGDGAPQLQLQQPTAGAASSKRPPPGRRRLVVTCSGFHGAAKQEAQRLASSLGAAYSADLVRGHTTHLVCRRLLDCFGSCKYTRALEWGVDVVSSAWLSDSAAAGRPLPEQQYKDDGTAELQPSPSEQRRRQQQQQRQQQEQEVVEEEEEQDEQQQQQQDEGLQCEQLQQERCEEGWQGEQPPAPAARPRAAGTLKLDQLPPDFLLQGSQPDEELLAQLGAEGEAAGHASALSMSLSQLQLSPSLLQQQQQPGLPHLVLPGAPVGGEPPQVADGAGGAAAFDFARACATEQEAPSPCMRSFVPLQQQQEQQEQEQQEESGEELESCQAAGQGAGRAEDRQAGEWRRLAEPGEFASPVAACSPAPPPPQPPPAAASSSPGTGPAASASADAGAEARPGSPSGVLLIPATQVDSDLDAAGAWSAAGGRGLGGVRATPPSLQYYARTCEQRRQALCAGPAAAEEDGQAGGGGGRGAWRAHSTGQQQHEQQQQELHGRPCSASASSQLPPPSAGCRLTLESSRGSGGLTRLRRRDGSRRLGSRALASELAPDPAELELEDSDCELQDSGSDAQDSEGAGQGSPRPPSAGEARGGSGSSLPAHTRLGAPPASPRGDPSTGTGGALPVAKLSFSLCGASQLSSSCTQPPCGGRAASPSSPAASGEASPAPGDSPGTSQSSGGSSSRSSGSSSRSSGSSSRLRLSQHGSSQDASAASEALRLKRQQLLQQQQQPLQRGEVVAEAPEEAAAAAAAPQRGGSPLSAESGFVTRRKGGTRPLAAAQHCGREAVAAAAQGKGDPGPQRPPAIDGAEALLRDLAAKQQQQQQQQQRSAMLEGRLEPPEPCSPDGDGRLLRDPRGPQRPAHPAGPQPPGGAEGGGGGAWGDPRPPAGGRPSGASSLATTCLSSASASVKVPLQLRGGCGTTLDPDDCGSSATSLAVAAGGQKLEALLRQALAHGGGGGGDGGELGGAACAEGSDAAAAAARDGVPHQRQQPAVDWLHTPEEQQQQQRQARAAVGRRRRSHEGGSDGSGPEEGEEGEEDGVEISEVPTGHLAARGRPMMRQLGARLAHLSQAGGEEQVIPLKLLAKAARGSTAKAFHGLRPQAKLVYAEQVQVPWAHTTLSTKERSRCAIVQGATAPEARCRPAARQREPPGGGGGVFLAEPVAFYRLESGEWWVELLRFHSAEDLKALARQAGQRLHLPPDFQLGLELLRGVAHEHAPMHLVQGEFRLKKVRRAPGGGGGGGNHRAGAGGSPYWRFSFDAASFTVLADRPAPGDLEP